MCSSGLPKTPMPNAVPTAKKTKKKKNTAARAMADVWGPLETGRALSDTFSMIALGLCPIERGEMQVRTALADKNVARRPRSNIFVAILAAGREVLDNRRAHRLVLGVD